MSITPLSTTEELIERSYFHSIRKELVDKGYLPDIDDTVTYPDTNAGYAAWKAAINTIVTNKGFCIEVFNYASSESRGSKKVPRIVIQTTSAVPGTIGGDSTYYFRPSGGQFNGVIRPPQTVDFFFNIHLLGMTAEQMRVMNAVIALALPRRGYIPFYDDPDYKFYIENTQSNSYDSARDNIMERILAYKSPDLYDRAEITALSNIAQINEIRIEPTVNGSDTDPIIVT